MLMAIQGEWTLTEPADYVPKLFHGERSKFEETKQKFKELSAMLTIKRNVLRKALKLNSPR